MFELWKNELTKEEADALISKAATEIKKRRLEAPAVLFLEAHKPLGYIASHAAIAFSPFLVPFLGFDNVNNMTRLASKRENIERLIEAIESDGPPPGKEGE